MNGYRYSANLLKALAHPARLRILDVLIQDGPCCVCHLESKLGQRQAYISQQLARLREAGLVQDRREGLNAFYSLVDSSLAELCSGLRQGASKLGESQGRVLQFPRAAHQSPCPCPACKS